MNYIESAYQLPEKAESLHGDQDFLATCLILAKAFEPAIDAFRRLAKAVEQALKQVFTSVWRFFVSSGLVKPSRKKHYHVPYKPRKVNRKRAMIAQRKMAERYA